jgi:formylglycine-generating enzyme required for sulfatase activity
MRDGLPPEWASGYGFDAFGPFASFTVGEAVQCLRWVPPTVFQMGSPEGEAGRGDNEAQHEVKLTEGYWMADTPLTQALWTAVMGDNRSNYVHPQRPVEQVSWNDAQRFIEKLNTLTLGLEMRLPTEAEWECACRAGANTATYAGDLEILGERNAPSLGVIAWYGGNSGVDFDLASGYDSGVWDEVQFEHEQAGTRIVGLKAPNGFGLYDTLGNVWEWCSDWYAAYNGTAVNPVGPTKGVHRVFRGGSWGSRARDVRAAYRNGYEPDDCYGYLGFRLCRGQRERTERGALGLDPRVSE